MKQSKTLSKYLFPVNAWALSFGCAVGWGSFVMPGTTFLPAAGPLGTALGIGIGAVVMLIIGICYYYLMMHYPDAGGTFTYAARVLGHDHGFLAAWFLILVYVAIIWANATALILIARNLFGSLFQFGFHYVILGYDVYFGEVLLTMVAIVLVALICIYGKVAAGWIQTVMAILLITGILVCFIGVIMKVRGAETLFQPHFSPEGGSAFRQIFSVVILSPWAFVGFESVSHSTEEFRFPVKKVITIMISALVASTAAYILLTLIGAAIHPAAYPNWPEYIKMLPMLSGLEGLPTFFSTYEAIGPAGEIILGVTVLCGILTGLVGNYIASSRLLYAMSKEQILPKWFGKLNRQSAPSNAFLFLMLISLFIPFLGRTAIGWIVDVTTIGATIAYTYVSATALILARREKKKFVMAAGILGLILSVTFFVYFMALSGGALATESYLILAAWAILGFVYFRFVFSRNRDRQLGKSIVVWAGLLFLIFFTSLMWMRQATDEMTETAIGNISDYYEEMNPESDFDTRKQTEHYIAYQMNEADRKLAENSLLQMVLIIGSLIIMFSIYNIMRRREMEAEMEKVRAEESNVAKSAFLSNMSHDIRTPMNAIIGYINLAERDQDDPEKLREYLSKIKTSSDYMLALINDVLEMSRIESGRMELESVPVDLEKLIGDVRDVFATQMQEKKITFTVNTTQVVHRNVLCDKTRLNRVLMNLISNAYKFTPEGGRVSLILREFETEEKESSIYELRVKDTGIGMSQEFAERVFEAFEREENSTVSGIQGTGLGMSITKSIVELMGGEITVRTVKGEGTEFRIRIALPSVGDTEAPKETAEKTVVFEEMDPSKIRLLIAEDMEVNREIAVMLLSGHGFKVETAENGKEAVEKIASREAGYYDAVLMDIQMPVMNGYEATRAIRELSDPARSRIPVIAMTANAFSEDVKMAEEAGMDGHIAKPIDLNTILAALDTALKREMP